LTIETTNVDVDDEYAANHDGCRRNYVMLGVSTPPG
jgi:hypothetical protein